MAAPRTYAADSVLRLAAARVHIAKAALAVQSDRNSQGTDIYARQGSPVIAVNLEAPLSVRW